MPEGMSFSLSRRVHQLLEDVQLVKRTSFHMYKFPSDKSCSSICSFFFSPLSLNYITLNLNYHFPNKHKV